MEAIANYFRFGERTTNAGTEVRAGITTFVVMAYIIFLNPAIIAQPLGLDPVAVATATALIAGLLTIAMGIFGNAPFALAAGLGLNAIVAFQLTGEGLDAKGAMGVIVLEGILILLLVLAGFREAVMNAVPVSLRRSIGVGIGLFILTIGFVDGGLVTAGTPIVSVAFPTTTAQFVFLFGLFLTFALYILKVRAALIIAIAVTSVVAFLTGVTTLPTNLAVTPSFSTIGNFDITQIFTKLPLITAVLTVFAIMLSDFFDTMGTVTGISAEAGLTRPDGSIPKLRNILLVDSVGAIAGGVGGISSNTTYIESAAGVAEGGRTGFASVITGVLFLLAVFLAPLTQLIPSQATAPALVLVGYLMFQLVRDIPVADVDEGLPALLTIILMPLTYNITVGIGAGFITWVFIKVVRRQFDKIHPLMWIVAIAFLVYFLTNWIQTFFK